MIVDLDSASSLDPVRVGAKAAALAAAKAAGAPVLPGFVVEGLASTSHMRLGAETLESRGSGGARLAVTAEPIAFGDELVTAGERLGDHLVARSSTLLESSGAWSGAFTSYVDITPSELPRAVAGCWASAFSVDALERQEAADIAPGSIPMSVLVQPGLVPEAGGWAELDDTGSVVVHGVKGPPAPLLQGWSVGHAARYDDHWSGDDLLDLVGESNLDDIRSLLRLTSERLSSNRCEWALTDQVWALQISRAIPAQPPPTAFDTADMSGLVELARALIIAPGPMGERFVLPWAIAGIPDVDIPEVSLGSDCLEEIRELADDLAAQVWGQSPEAVRGRVIEILAQIGDEGASDAAAVIRGLSTPNPSAVSRLLGLLRALRVELAHRGAVPQADSAWHLDPRGLDTLLGAAPGRLETRVGIGRWEPLVSAIVLSEGTRHQGTPASPGFGAGKRFTVTDPHRVRGTSRAVIEAPQPLPNFASLLWDSAAIVAAAGSPAAHLFEAARALRVPAACGVDLGPSRSQIVAVDGYSGTVATIDLPMEL